MYRGGRSTAHFSSIQRGIRLRDPDPAYINGLEIEYEKKKKGGTGSSFCYRVTVRSSDTAYKCSRRCH